jgi:hypothetical protein
MVEESGMTEIEKLAELLHASSPELDLRLDAPGEVEGSTWLDVEQEGRVVAVEWRPRHGFGLSLLETAGDPRAGLFEGPDEILTDPYSARDRILSLLTAHAPMRRPLRLSRGK